MKYQYPIEDEYPFYVLIETSGSDADHDTEVSALVRLQIFP